jgi:hypothetical protein
VGQDGSTNPTTAADAAARGVAAKFARRMQGANADAAAAAAAGAAGEEGQEQGADAAPATKRGGRKRTAPAAAAAAGGGGGAAGRSGDIAADLLAQLAGDGTK